MKALVSTVFLLLVPVLAGGPTQAACATSHPLSTTGGSLPADRSFVWSSTVFDPFYFPEYAPLDYQHPISSSFVASFWVLGAGDPAPGAGYDNGTRNLYPGDLAFGSYMYPVFPAAELSADWNSMGVDAPMCPMAGSCTCLLLNDVDPPQVHGLFAIVGATTDPVNGTSFHLAGNDPLGNALPIVLREIPRPSVTSVARPQADTVEVALTVPTRTSGVYEAASAAGCSCAPTEFLIRQQDLPRGSVPPLGRDLASWSPALLPGGGVQPRTPTDGTVTIEATCSGGDTDVYLVTELFFDSGFSTSFVSGNSIAVECGGNLSGEFLSDVRDANPLFELPGSGGKRR